jgi:transcriptional regulator with XRE-family HTH domain
MAQEVKRMKIISEEEMIEVFRQYKKNEGLTMSEISSVIFFSPCSIYQWFNGYRRLSMDAYFALWCLLEHEGYLPSCHIENYERFINLELLEQFKQKHAKR